MNARAASLAAVKTVAVALGDLVDRVVFVGGTAVMPSADTGIGPTNRWYSDALRGAATRDLGGLQIRVITPAYFVATKLEAFRSRGKGDFLASHDIEDVLTVLGGLTSLRDQIAAGGTGIADSLRRELAKLGANEAFLDALPGHFEGTTEGQARAGTTRVWLTSLRRG